MGKPIYVEIAIQAPLEELWRLTQSPDLHQRWDLRFTRIAYLPRPDPGEPQRFRYETHEGPIAFRFPLLFSGVADVHEWFDDATQRFGIEVVAVPPHVRPLREERRE